MITLGEQFLEDGAPVEALACFVAAALKGDWAGWLYVAQIIEDRPGQDDDSLALFYRQKYLAALEEAAANGDVNAVNRLVGIYEFGQPGSLPNPPRALELLRQLASGGNSAAQFELFEKYFYGLCSAPKDRGVALDWLRMAAQGGSVEGNKWLAAIERWDEQGFEYPRSKNSP